MIHVLSEKVQLDGTNFICEQKVIVDGEKSCKYVVYEDFGKHFACDKSYIDYKNGLGPEPNMIEMNDNLFAFSEDEPWETPFIDIYEHGSDVTSLENFKVLCFPLELKQLTKPAHSGKFEVISRRKGMVANFQDLTIYEIKFKTKDGKILYAFYNFAEDSFAIGENSFLDAFPFKEIYDFTTHNREEYPFIPCPLKIVERYDKLKDAENSEYYEMFYALGVYIEKDRFYLPFESLAFLEDYN